MQVNVLSAISEDRLDQVSQYKVKVDQDYSHQIAPDLPVFCLIQKDPQARCRVSWFWDEEGRPFWGQYEV